MAHLGAKVIILFLTLAILTISFGVFVIIFHRHIVRYQLSRDLILTDGSLAVKLWEKRPDFPIYYSIKILNYTDDFKTHESIGPYRFASRKEKRNISFNGVDQVIYDELRTYSYIPTAEFDLSDKIMTHDPTNDGLLQTTVADIVRSFFRNNTETRFVIKSGYAGVSLTGFLINVNNMPYFGTKFYGYSVGPDVKQNTVIDLFDSDFCRTTPFHFSATHKINGTTVFMFTHDPEHEVETMACARDIPYTVTEMAKDQIHLPSYFDVEPFTGWILRSAFRRKVTSKASSPSGRSFDILTWEESADATSQTSEELDGLVFYKMRVIISVAGYFILAGVVILVILLTAHLRSKRAHADVATAMTDLSAAPENMFKL